MIEILEILETYNINYVVPIFSVCVSAVIFYFSNRSRKRHVQELKEIFESITHQPAEFTTTHKPTEEFRKFLEKPSSIVRPSPSAFKTFLFGLLILFSGTLVIVFLWKESDSKILDDIILGVGLSLYIYAIYLGVSSILRGLYRALKKGSTRKILLLLIVLFIFLMAVSA